MPYITNEGRVLVSDKAFSHNNISFPANWLRLSTPADKEAQGISWVTPEEPPVVRAPVERLVEQGIVQAKDTAWKLLHPSDWRELPDKNMPEEWAAYRAGVVAECQKLEGEYALAESYEDFDKIKQEWPLNPDEQAERDRMEAEEAAAKAKREEDNDGGV